MKKSFLLTSILVGGLMTCSYTFAAETKNIDTPNLDFSLGESGWTFQTGWYTTPLKGSPSEYTYVWDHKSVGNSKPVAMMDITAKNGAQTLAMSDEEKSRFWRSTTVQQEKKLSFLPLYTMPNENRSGVMRIGRPEPWKGNSNIRYTLKGSMGGPGTVDSDGKPVDFPKRDYSVTQQHCYDAGCEFYGSHNNGTGLTSKEWHNPYANYTKNAHNPWAGAERMYYDFTVTENSTLLIYRFLAILSSPESSSNHSENGYPEMVINVLVRNDQTGKWEHVPCSEQHVTASEFNKDLDYPGMKPMFPAVPFAEGPNTFLFKDSENGGVFLSENCNQPASHNTAHNIGNATGSVNQNCFLNYATVLPDNQRKLYVSRYHYSGWKTRYADLRSYIGKTVRLEVLNHDCLMNHNPDGTNAVVAGGHSSYGYFQAETKRMDLIVPACDLNNREGTHDDKVRIIAPEGFSASAGTYEWSLGGRPYTTIMMDPVKPNVAYLYADSIWENTTVYCTINMDTTDTGDCSTIKLTTDLRDRHESTIVKPDFRIDDLCGGQVRLVNTTKVISGADMLDTCYWRISNGIGPAGIYDLYGNEAYYVFHNPSSYYKVSLTVVTLCGRSYTKDSTVLSPDFLTGNWLENQKVCEGGEFKMCPKVPYSDYTYSWYELDDPLGRLDTLRPISTEPCITGRILDEPRRYFGVVVTSPGLRGAPVCRYERTAFVASVKKPDLKAVVDNPNPCPDTKVTLSVEKPEAGCDYIWSRVGFPQQWRAENGSRSVSVYDSNKRFVFHVRATNRNGCTSEDTIGVITKDAPVIRLDSIADACYGEEVYASAWDDSSSNVRAELYYWSINEEQERVGSNEAVFKRPSTREGMNEVRVRAKDSEECFSNTATRKFHVGKSRNFTFDIQRFDTSIAYNDTVSVGDTLRLQAYELDVNPPYDRRPIPIGCTCVWNNNPVLKGTTALVVVKPGMHSVSLSVTAEDGCVTEVVRNFVVREEPSLKVRLVADSLACEGAHIQFLAIVDDGLNMKSYIYRWKRNNELLENTEMIYKVEGVSWLDAGTYTVEVLDEYGRVLGSASSYLEVVPTPTVKIADARDICRGDTVRLWANLTAPDYRSVNYRWETPGGEFYGPEIAYIPDPSDIRDGLHTIFVFASRNGCGAQDSLSFKVFAQPRVDIQGPSFICEGDEVEVKAIPLSSNTEFEWITEDENNGSQDTIIKVSKEGVLKVFATREICQALFYDTITMRAYPDIRILGDTNACVGDTIRLYAMGARDFLWSTGVTGNVFDFWAEKPGIYSYKLTGHNGDACVREESFNIVVHELPELQIEGATAVCEGEYAFLTAHGADHYLWSSFDGKTLYSEVDTVHLYPEHLGTNTYKLEGRNEIGCKSSLMFNVYGREMPKLVLEGGPYELCLGDLAKFSALGAESYVWMDMYGDTIYSKEQNLVLAPDRPGIQTYRLKGFSVDGCEAYEDFKLNVHASPNLRIVGDPEVCLGDEAMFRVVGAADTNYSWRDEDGIEFLIGSTFHFAGKEVGNYRYFINGHNEFGCDGFSELEVHVNKLPEVHIDSLASVTTVSQGAMAVVTAASTDSIRTWHWRPVERMGKSITVELDTTTTFVVTAYDEHTCKSTAEHTVVVTEKASFTVEGNETVCPGETVSLKAVCDKELEYTWRVLEGENETVVATGTEYTFTPNQNTIVIVKGRSKAGDVETEERVVNVELKPYPSLRINLKKVACYGSTAALSVDGASIYEWYDEKDSLLSQSSDLEIPNVTSPATYTVVGTNEYGCSSKADYHLAVRPAPTVSIEGLPLSEELCEGEKLFLVARANDSLYNECCVFPIFHYRWSDGTEGEGCLLTFDSVGKQQYSVVCVDSYGCQTEETMTFDVLKAPTIAIEGAHPVCEGSSITLTASGDADGWFWSTNDTSSVIQLDNLTSDTLVRLIGHSDRCVTDVSAFIPVFPLPALSVEGNHPVCKGDDLMLTAQGAATYQWETNEEPGAVLHLSNVTTGGIYALTGVSEEGCAQTTNVIVSVLNLPNVRILGPTKACLDDTVFLKAEGAVSYVWEDGSTSDGRLAIAGDKPYEVVGTDAHGCQNKAVLKINAIEKPKITILGDTVVCSGDTFKIAATSDVPNLEWVWSDGSRGQGYKKLAITSSQITVQASYGVCTAERTVDLIVNPLPVLGVEGRTNICKGESLSLLATGAQNYFWGDKEDGNTNPALFVANPTTSTYRLTGTDKNGCTSSVEIPVVVHDFPTLTIEAPDTVCKGDTVRLWTKSESCVKYLWGDSSKLSYRDVVPTKAVTYSVVGTDTFGCSTKATKKIQLYPSPKVKLSGDTRVCQGSTVRLQAEGALSYEWPDGSKLDYCDVVVSAKRKYTVIGRNEQGCSATASLTITAVKNPIISIKGDSAVCKGDSVKLQVSSKQAGTQWRWSDGTTEPRWAMLPSADTSVTVVATHDICSTEKKIAIKLKELPDVSVEGATFICTGSTLNLKGVGAKKYYWNGKSTNPLKLTLNRDSLFILKGVAANGCASEIEVPVKVAALPKVVIEGDSLTCSGAKNTLVAKADRGVSYLWSNKSTDSIISPKVTAVRTYKVTVTDTLGLHCKATASFVVTPIANPKVIVRGDDSIICGGRELALTGFNLLDSTNTQTKYVWSIAGEEKGEGAVYTDYYTQKTKVRLTATQGRCSAYKDTTLTVYANPTLTISGKTNICQKATLKLTPKAKSSATITGYTWTEGKDTLSDGVLTFPMDSVGSFFYALHVDDSRGCYTDSVVKVTVHRLPTLKVESQNLCSDSLFTLTVQRTDEEKENATSYIWKVKNGKDTLSTIDQLSVILSSPTTYVVSAKDVYGCKASLSKKVTPSTSTFKILGAEMVCAGADAVLSASNPNSSVSYTWYDKDPQTVEEAKSIAEGAEYEISEVKQAMTLYLVGDNGQCKVYAKHTLTPVDRPELKYTGNTEVCEGDVAKLVADGKSDGILYAWNDQKPATRAEYTSEVVELGETYEVKLTGAKGECASELLIPITVNPTPKASVLAKEVYSGEEFVLSYELEDNGAVILTEKWYSDLGLLGGKYAESMDGMVENHPWTTSFSTTTDDVFKMNLELVTDKGCTQSLPIEIPVKARVVAGKYRAFNALGQIIGVFDLNDEEPLIDQLSFYRGFEILFLQPLDDDGALLKVRVNKK